MTKEKLTIDVCVCTFRRPELEATIRSLAAMELPEGARVGIIIADNDETPSAAPLVEDLKKAIALPILYLHAPARNISVARNSCLNASKAQYVAFIDDDEIATPQWLVSLVEALHFRNADVVLGPVRAIYGNDAPDWLRRGDFHSTKPVWVEGKIRTGYTCNVLMDMAAPSMRETRFNLERGQTGGEDTEFFDRVYQDGGKIAFAPEAWVDEFVPHSRASFRWLAKRRFRSGQTHGRLLRTKQSSGAVPRLIVVAAAKSLCCLAGALVNLANNSRRNGYLIRGTLHLGTIAGLTGVRELKQYGLASSSQSAG